MEERIVINDKYKDRLFRFIFGGGLGNEYPLSLYNAVQGTDYDNPDDLEITTLDDVVFMHMKNDVSVLFNNRMSFFEQQSTICGNMALRNFLYAGRVYSKYVDQNENRLYGRKKLMIPTPECITFYNGTDNMPAVYTQKLSEHFINSLEDGNYEWTVKIINLNHIDNRDMINKSKPLQEYVAIISKIQFNISNGMQKDEAIISAIDSCIEEGIMSDLLRQFKSEVISMCLTEFNEESYEKVIREEGRAEGRAEGLAEGKEAGIEATYIELVKCGLISSTIAAERLKMSEEDFAKLLG